MYINPNNIQIRLDSSVRHITRTACMAISGYIENGLIFSGTDCNAITIYKNRIDFGKSVNSDLSNVHGHFYVNFYREYGNIVYRFGSNFKWSFFSKTIDYCGIFAPEAPDNELFFNMIYPKFS